MLNINNMACLKWRTLAVNSLMNYCYQRGLRQKITSNSIYVLIRSNNDPHMKFKTVLSGTSKNRRYRTWTHLGLWNRALFLLIGHIVKVILNSDFKAEINETGDRFMLRSLLGSVFQILTQR